MKYISTRDKGHMPEKINSAEAIKRGLAPDGGLYLPESIPTTDTDFISSLSGLSYSEQAVKILSLYLDDYTEAELTEDCTAAYGAAFGNDPTPVVRAEDGVYCLELWHGPTCAFKDMALQLMPRLLSRALRKTGETRTALVLVATSGDTGKAALEGYKDVPGVAIKVFYPVDGVSRIQKLQMMTQEGSNVDVCAIKGNFDDAQTGVKRIFSDDGMRAELDRRGYFLSSANSINWGRLVPQIVYYYSGYVSLVDAGVIKLGDSIDVAVPTGNFGNIFAAYLARRMGLPIRRLICASNSNNILTDFLTDGVYDRNRPFHTTMSPSMDILISSNLERLLFIASGYSDEFVREMMGDLKQKGKYTMPENVMSAINSVFCAGCCDDEGTKDTIKKTFEDYGYLCDTHTAVGINVYEKYAEKTGDKTPTVIDSTANPFKFSRSVLDADEPGASEGLDEFSMVGELARVTKTSCPPQLADLRDKPVRFRDVCDRDSMEKAVFRLLGI